MAKTIVAILVGTIIAGSTVRNAVGLRAQTQSQMNTDADRALRSAEAEMATVLQNLTKKASAQPAALARLNRAQTAWVAYRDAHLEALWPSKHLCSRTAPCIRCVSRWNERTLQRNASENSA